MWYTDMHTGTTDICMLLLIIFKTNNNNEEKEEEAPSSWRKCGPSACDFPGVAMVMFIPISSLFL